MEMKDLYKLASKILNKTGGRNNIIRECLIKHLEVGDTVYYTKTVEGKEVVTALTIDEFIIIDDAPEEYMKDGIRGYRVYQNSNRPVDIPVNHIEWKEAIQIVAQRELTAKEIRYTLNPELLVKENYPEFNLDDSINFGIEIEGGSNNAEMLLDDMYDIGYENVYDSSVEVYADWSDELVLRGYKRGKELKKKIYQTIQVLENHDFITNESCGIHFHISDNDDNDNISSKNLFKFLKLYVEFEPILYKLLPYSRVECRHSRSLKESNDTFYKTIKNLPSVLFNDIRMDDNSIKNLIGSAWYNANHYDDYCHNKYDESRYCGLNVHSYFFRGTLEFRHFHGDYQAIPYFVDLINNLYSASKNEARRAIDNTRMTDEDSGNRVARLLKYFGIHKETVEYLMAYQYDLSDIDFDSMFDDNDFVATNPEEDGVIDWTILAS